MGLRVLLEPKQVLVLPGALGEVSSPNQGGIGLWKGILQGLYIEKWEHFDLQLQKVSRLWNQFC